MAEAKNTSSTSKGNWFERNWGWVLLLLGGVVFSFFGYKAYRKRWRTFGSEGMARFIGGTTAETQSWWNNQAFRFSAEQSGLKEGDEIEVRDTEETGCYKTGKTKIKALHTQKHENGKTYYWVVTDFNIPHVCDGETPGELRFVSR